MIDDIHIPPLKTNKYPPNMDDFVGSCFLCPLFRGQLGGGIYIFILAVSSYHCHIPF